LIAVHLPDLAPGSDDTSRLIFEIFGQIEYRRFYFAMHGMDYCIGRMTQRDDSDVDSTPFQAEDFLRDEGLGKAGISLKDECDGHGLCLVLIRRWQ
jgi:hypothetical protein